MKNTALVLLGRDNSEEFEKMLTRDGVNYIHECTDGEIRENVTVHSDTETRISLETAGISEDACLHLLSTAGGLVRQGDLVAFSGRLPVGVDKRKIVKSLKSLSGSGAKLFVDTNSFDMDDIRKLRPYLIKPNEFELAEITGENISSRDDVLRAGKMLCAAGNCRVLVSLGERGAMLVTEDGAYFARAPKIDAVSTIGAGDSTLAGFISAKAEGRSDSDALVRSVAWGTAKCTEAGTLPPKKDTARKTESLIKAENL